MPELPEVETMVRGIRPFVAGRRIESFRRCHCPCKPISMTPGFSSISRRVTGQTVTDVRRLAKRILFELSSEEILAIEPRMTGLLLLDEAPSAGHLRLEWRFADQREFNSLWFWDRRGLGTVRLYRPEEVAMNLSTTKLGPDALQMSPERWRDACRDTSREIKVALLDQKLVAGIGNLYASEILHLARIDPRKPADRLTAAEIKRLAAATQSILETAIEYEGSTLNDFTYRNALNRNGRYQSKHRVYRRAGEKCGTCCKSPIERIVQAQRSTFFCPRCQQ